MLIITDVVEFDVGSNGSLIFAHFSLDDFVNGEKLMIWKYRKPAFGSNATTKFLKSYRLVSKVVSSKGIIGLLFLRETIATERHITVFEQFNATLEAFKDRLGISLFLYNEYPGYLPHRDPAVFSFLEEFVRYSHLQFQIYWNGHRLASMLTRFYPCNIFLWAHIIRHPATLDEMPHR